MWLRLRWSVPGSPFATGVSSAGFVVFSSLGGVVPSSWFARDLLPSLMGLVLAAAVLGWVFPDGLFFGGLESRSLVGDFRRPAPCGAVEERERVWCSLTPVPVFLVLTLQTKLAGTSMRPTALQRLHSVSSPSQSGQAIILLLRLIIWK